MANKSLRIFNVRKIIAKSSQHVVLNVQYWVCKDNSYSFLEFLRSTNVGSFPEQRLVIKPKGLHACPILEIIGLKKFF